MVIKLLFILSVVGYNAVAQPSSGYHLLRKLPIGGTGWWDYLTVDAAARLLYVSHGSHVVVLNLVKGDSVGQLANTPGIHGIAVVPKLGRAYTTNGATATASVFDANTRALLNSFPTDKKPDALLYDEHSKRIFIFNNEGGTATAYDPFMDKVVGTVTLGGAPEAGVSDGKGTVYVNLEDTHEVVGINTQTLQVMSRWSLSPGQEPTGLAMDRKRKLLFSACGNGMLICLSAVDGKLVSSLPIGSRTDGAVYDAERGLVFTSNGSGTLSVIKISGTATLEKLADVPTAMGARTLALDPQTHKLYTCTADFGPTPAATEASPRPRPAALPGTFAVLELGL